jgi:hypothetical protein
MEKIIGYWARDFTSRVSVESGILRIVLPMDRLINITSINQLKVSNWLEIEGTIDDQQKNLSIPYNARGSPTCRTTGGNLGYFNIRSPLDITEGTSGRSPGQDPEKKR